MSNFHVVGLRYGVDSVVEIESTGDLVADCRTPRGEPLADIAAAVSSALSEPLDFPSLRRSVVPGDRVAVRLGAGVPHAAALASSLVANLLEAGIAPGDIWIVHPGTDPTVADGLLKGGLPADVQQAVQVVAHDPNHRDVLSYLAADDKGDPIYINRHLVDADVVLPIGCMRLSSTPGYFGVNAAIYPTFSDTATIDRFRRHRRHPSSDEVACRRRDADEIAWLLGVLLTIQVVPAAAGGVLHIVAGTADSVERRALACSAKRHGSTRFLTVLRSSLRQSRDLTNSRPGRTSAEPLRLPREWSLTTARSHFAQSWRRPPGPALSVPRPGARSGRRREADPKASGGGHGGCP